jgi:hypothetical protein
MKKRDIKKTIARVQIIFGIIFLLTSIIGTYYINSNYYFSEEYNNEGNPKGIFLSTISNFISTYAEYSEAKKDKYIESLGYTDEMYYFQLDNELYQTFEENYESNRESMEVVSTVLMFGLIGKSFMLTYTILGFIASIISIMLILTGFYNYHK